MPMPIPTPTASFASSRGIRHPDLRLPLHSTRAQSHHLRRSPASADEKSTDALKYFLANSLIDLGLTAAHNSNALLGRNRTKAMLVDQGMPEKIRFMTHDMEEFHILIIFRQISD
jgi:hypothetical protein